MERPAPIEFQIVRSLIMKEYGPKSPFLDQLAAVQRTPQQMTGKGFYLDLLLPQSTKAIDKQNAELSVDCRTSLGEPYDLVGFTLFIRDGLLSFLEGYTFGPFPWPAEPMEEWLILDAAGAGTPGPDRPPCRFDLAPHMRAAGVDGGNGTEDDDRQLHDIWTSLAA